MPTFEDAGPFSDVEIDDTRLASAPLAKVLTQLRFPGALGVLTGDRRVGSIAEALADAGFPLFEEGRQMNLQITPEGVRTHEGARLWTFQSAERAWQVTLTSEFVTLETTQYGHRNDMVERVEKLVDALGQVVNIPSVGRVGYRYVNRVENATRDDCRVLLRREFHAGLAVPGDGAMFTTVSEALYSLGHGSTLEGVRDGLLARWGALQPGQVLEPSIPPVASTSLVLDIDAFRHVDVAFESNAIANHVTEMSVRAYRFFRWSVTPEFLTRFGAAPK